MAWQREDDPPYLRPYREAARRHGGGFASLLWASRYSQGLRFDALTRICDFTDKWVLDVGAGRGDLLEYLKSRRMTPRHYYAIEAIDPLAREIERRGGEACTVIRADFVRQPHRMFVGADVVVFSGSLNTLQPAEAFAALRRGFEAATEALVFNFLCDPCLAGAPHLHWYPRGEMAAFLGTLSGRVRLLHDYLEGDCTARVDRPPAETEQTARSA